MKVILLVVMLFTSVKMIYSQDLFELNWKLDDGLELNYNTMMKEKSPINVDSLFNSLPDSFYDELDEEELAYLEKTKKQTDETEICTSIRNSNHFENVLEITMVNMNQIIEPYMDRVYDSLNVRPNNILLRGTLEKNGSIHSFWMKRAQKNLLSLFFELPNFPVKKGDVWALPNVNFTGNDQNFICYEAKKRNRVQLLDVIFSDVDTIAVINYDLMEYVKGDFTAAGLFNKENETTFESEVVFAALAKFSITKGKWIEFNGEMKAKSKGFMNHEQTQIFSLIETKSCRE